MTALVKRLRQLYDGDSKAAFRFRAALLAFDIATISFFVAASFVHDVPFGAAIDAAIAVVLAAEYAARLAISRRRLAFAADPVSLADLVVIVSLLAATLSDSWTFLRILRALRLLRSYRVVRQLRSRFAFFRRHEDVVQGAVNLLVFLFVMTAIVFVTQSPTNPAIANYLDALYFTVTTLTTTGFGDITLQGQGGRLLAVLIMIFGISLFLRLVHAIFRPPHVRFT